MRSKYYTLDTSQLPIVICKLHPVEPTIDDFHQMFDDMEEVFANSTGPIVNITDNTEGTNWLSSQMRIAIGKRLEQLNAKYFDRNLAAVMVFHSPMARIMLKGVNLVVKHQTPQYIVKTMDEAILKAKEILEEVQV